MNKINILEKLSLFDDYWNPRIIAQLNGQYVKLAKLKGEFVWHKHDDEDELFYVLEGKLKIEFRNKTEILEKGECIVIPKGVDHKPVAEEEVSVMLFEPISTSNTGDNPGEFTKNKLNKI